MVERALSAANLLFKIVLIGDGGVGKTSLRRRFMGEAFTTKYIETIGADFAVKELTASNGTQIRFQIWDLAGQPRFRAVREGFYKGSRGALLVYDVTKGETYNNVPIWAEELRKNVAVMPPIVLVGNKIDLRVGEGVYVTPDYGEMMREYLERRYEVPVYFIETSAKTGENIQKAFYMLAEMILTQRRLA
ncbi:hypothetical protein DRO48_00745 [Candidatus Bathyarchaeota archaeon]|nr:MAG: hypothetical protein DRO48_00745 [Candidatus Bathyarchaeota archaeon]